MSIFMVQLTVKIEKVEEMNLRLRYVSSIKFDFVNYDWKPSLSF